MSESTQPCALGTAGETERPWTVEDWRMSQARRALAMLLAPHRLVGTGCPMPDRLSVTTRIQAAALLAKVAKVWTGVGPAWLSADERSAFAL